MIREGRYIINPTLVEHFNLLAGSLALDERFREDFIEDRLGAIHRFNTEFAPRYLQKRIELTDNEKKLVNALLAHSVEEFISLLAVITTA